MAGIVGFEINEDASANHGNVVSFYSIVGIRGAISGNVSTLDAVLKAL